MTKSAELIPPTAPAYWGCATGSRPSAARSHSPAHLTAPPSSPIFPSRGLDYAALVSADVGRPRPTSHMRRGFSWTKRSQPIMELCRTFSAAAAVAAVAAMRGGVLAAESYARSRLRLPTTSTERSWLAVLTASTPFDGPAGQLASFRVLWRCEQVRICAVKRLFWSATSEG